MITPIFVWQRNQKPLTKVGTSITDNFPRCTKSKEDTLFKNALTLFPSLFESTISHLFRYVVNHNNNIFIKGSKIK